MIRKLMLGALAVVGIGFGTQTASANPPVVLQPSTGGMYLPQPVPVYPTYPQPRRDIDFVVYIKRGVFGPWQRYGRYETFHQARHAERQLERQGYRVRIDEVRDHRHW